jgi:signal peptidase I
MTGGRPTSRAPGGGRTPRRDAPVVHPMVARRHARRRPPRTLPLARLARWPRPFGCALAVLVALVGAFVWDGLVWAAAVVWGLTAAAAVLDARLRGRFGIVSGVAAALLGPAAVVVSSLAFRRAVRKVTPGYGGAVPIALIALVAGVFVCERAGGFVVRHLADTITVPNPAMAPELRQGDRVIVSRRDVGDVRLRDIVVVRSFPRSRAALGGTGPYAGVFRVVATQGQWIGATDDGVYVCPPGRRPDVFDGVTKQDGCTFPDESSYVANRTVPFGPVRVDDVSYFVMGDNRAVGGDSREFGSVPIEHVEGTVVATLWPLERVGIR